MPIPNLCKNKPFSPVSNFAGFVFAVHNASRTWFECMDNCFPNTGGPSVIWEFVWKKKVCIIWPDNEIMRDPNVRFTGTDCRKVILRYHFVDSAAKNVSVFVSSCETWSWFWAALKIDQAILSCLVSYYYTVRSDDVKVLKSRWNFVKTKTRAPGNNIYTLLVTFIAFTSFLSSKFHSRYFPYKLYYACTTCVHIMLGPTVFPTEILTKDN